MVLPNVVADDTLQKVRGFEIIELKASENGANEGTLLASGFLSELYQEFRTDETGINRNILVFRLSASLSERHILGEGVVQAQYTLLDPLYCIEDDLITFYV